MSASAATSRIVVGSKPFVANRRRAAASSFSLVLALRRWFRSCSPAGAPVVMAG